MLMRGDSSPYFTVLQVIPRGHVEERVQGELMREQLEDRGMDRQWVMATGIKSEKKKRRLSSSWVYLIDTVLIHRDGLEPLHQRLHLWISVCLWSQSSIYNVQRSKPFRSLVQITNRLYLTVLMLCTTKKNAYHVSAGSLYNRYPNGRFKFEHISGW